MRLFDKVTFEAKQTNITEIVNYVDSKLNELKIKRNKITSTKLILEETVNKLINDNCAVSGITVQIKKNAWKTDVFITCKGEKFENTPTNMGIDLEMEADDNTEQIIGGMILNAYSDRFRAGYKNGINKIAISADISSQKNVFFCLYAIALALITGFLLRIFGSETAAPFVNDHILTPVTAIIMNSLKMLMAPIIFFSIACSMGMFGDIKEFGRIGVKVFAFYTFTTIAAIFISLGVFNLLGGCEPGCLSFISDSATESLASISVRDMIINIVPSNIFAAFHEANTLQIIFLSIIIGICANRLGNYSSTISNALNALNELFTKVAELIVRLLPLVVFTSVASMIISLNLKTVTVYSSITLVMFLTLIILLIFYLIVCMIRLKKSPIEIIKRSAPAWLNAFSLSSSNASIPYTMKICKDNLKISPKLYSFSIPFGATVNMDGATTVLVLSFLFMAKGLNISLSFGDYISLIFIVAVLAMGAPGIPGAMLLCTTVLFQQFGIPVAGVALITPLLILFDPIISANNVVGDMVGSMYVAKGEGLIGEWSDK